MVCCNILRNSEFSSTKRSEETHPSNMHALLPVQLCTISLLGPGLAVLYHQICSFEGHLSPPIRKFIWRPWLVFDMFQHVWSSAVSIWVWKLYAPVFPRPPPPPPPQERNVIGDSITCLPASKAGGQMLVSFYVVHSSFFRDYCLSWTYSYKYSYLIIHYWVMRIWTWKFISWIDCVKIIASVSWFLLMNFYKSGFEICLIIWSPTLQDVCLLKFSLCVVLVFW